MTSERPLNVLFLCTHNSARSIIAECVINRLGKDKFKGYSAGSQPSGRVHPYAMDLLRHLNYDTSKLRSKSWEEFAGPGAQDLDFAFTVCDDAANEVCPVWPGQPMTAHWGFPTHRGEGTETERRFAFADAHSMLYQRIGIFVKLPIRELDRLSLQQRLDEIGRTGRRRRKRQMGGASLKQKLGAEFLGTAMLLATVIGSGIMGARLPAVTGLWRCWATRCRPAPCSSS